MVKLPPIVQELKMFLAAISCSISWWNIAVIGAKDGLKK